MSGEDTEPRLGFATRCQRFFGGGTDEREIRGIGILAVLLVCGCTGFSIGMLVHPTWHQAIENAQAVSGVVEYPWPTPFYLLKRNSWTVVHQLLSVLLLAGVPEATLAFVLSGVVGMLSFQAVGMATLAVSRNWLLAVAAPILVLLTKTYDFGVIYPVFLLGFRCSHGVIGLSYALLALGLYAAGARKTGSFMIGLAPAVHASIGALLWVVAVAAVFWGRRQGDEKNWRDSLPGFAVGVLFVAASWAVHHYAVALPVPDPAPRAEIRRVFVACVRDWDSHQWSEVSRYQGVWLTVLFGVLAWTVIRSPQRCPRPGVRFLLRSLSAAGAVGGAGCLFSALPAAWRPYPLVVLMPGRILNLIVLGFVPVVLGLLASRRQSLLSSLGSLAFLLPMIAGCFRLVRQDALLTTAMAAGGLLVLSSVAPSLDDRLSTAHPRVVLALRRACLAVLGLFLFTFYMTFTDSPRGMIQGFAAGFRDWRNDPFLGAVAARPGVLLTASCSHGIQGRTRRPILIDGEDLDYLRYNPAIAPLARRVLRDVYGVDLLVPPPVRSGALWPDAGKALWEGRTPRDWATIRTAYGVTDILTGPDWVLQLPLVASDAENRLYTIPAVASDREASPSPGGP